MEEEQVQFAEFRQFCELTLAEKAPERRFAVRGPIGTFGFVMAKRIQKHTV